MFERKTILELNLDRQIGFVRASETRISFLLPALSVTMAIWFAGLKEADIANGFIVLNGTLSAIGIVLTFYFMWSSMFPQINGPKKSLIFFGSISSKSLDSYREQILNAGEDEYIDDLIEQIHINARIATEKYRAVGYAMMFWYISLLPLSLFIGTSLRKIINGA